MFSADLAFSVSVEQGGNAFLGLLWIISYLNWTVCVLSCCPTLVLRPIFVTLNHSSTIKHRILFYWSFISWEFTLTHRRKNQYSPSRVQWEDRKWPFLAVSLTLTKEAVGEGFSSCRKNYSFSLLLTLSLDFSGFNLSRTETHLIHTACQPSALQKRRERNLSLVTDAK